MNPPTSIVDKTIVSIISAERIATEVAEDIEIEIAVRDTGDHEALEEDLVLLQGLVVEDLKALEEDLVLVQGLGVVEDLIALGGIWIRVERDPIPEIQIICARDDPSRMKGICQGILADQCPKNMETIGQIAEREGVDLKHLIVIVIKHHLVSQVPIVLLEKIVCLHRSDTIFMYKIGHT